MTRHNETARNNMMATNDSVRDLIGLCSGLIALLDKETQHLKAMKPREIEGLLDQKSALALGYQQQVKHLAEDPVCLQAVEPVLRQELQEAMHKVQTEVARNARALEAARLANEKMLQAIVSAVSEKKGAVATYGSNGEASSADRDGAGAPVTLSVDQRL